MKLNVDSVTSLQKNKKLLIVVVSGFVLYILVCFVSLLVFVVVSAESDVFKATLNVCGQIVVTGHHCDSSWRKFRDIY